MHGLDVLLLNAVDRNVAHGRAGRSFDDRLRIVAVILLGFDERFDESRSDDLHVVPHCREAASPVVRSTTSLHHNCWSLLPAADHVGHLLVTVG
ncbi:hypothetical protein QFZ97_004886 [Paraburkholderia youngii]